MKRRTLAVAFAAAAILGVSWFCFRPERKLLVPNPAVTLRYVHTGEFVHDGEIRNGTTFWVTNHTSDTFIISLIGFEVKTGANWIPQPTPLRDHLIFPQSDKPWGEPFLKPHGFGYATVQLTGAPTGVTWRVRAMVHPAVTGLAEVGPRFRAVSNRVKARVRTGNTNISVNPSQKGHTYFGDGKTVTTQEIVDE